MMAAPRLPASPDLIDAEFFTACLRERGALPADVSVTRAHKERLGSESGNTGAFLFRVRLEFSKPTDMASTLVLKFSDTGKMVTPTQRDSAIERAIILSTGYSDVRMLQLETSFYAKHCRVLTEPLGIRTPKVYYACMDGHSTRSSVGLFVAFGVRQKVRGAIIMEDLGAGKTYDAVGPVPEPDMLRILETVAKFHGASAKMLRESGGNEAALFGPGFDPKAFNYDLTHMSKGVARMVKKRWTKHSGVADRVLKRWGGTDLSVLVADPEVFLALKAVERHYATRIYPLLAKRHPFRCVLQGDLHAGNYMFMPDSSLVLYDWQMWGFGHPIPEVHYFFSTHFQPDRAKEDEFLKAYHAELERSSAMAYPWPAFRRDFDVACLDYLAAMMIRRGNFETPEIVAANVRKRGALITGIQRLLTARETLCLQRVKQLWKLDPTFAGLELV